MYVDVLRADLEDGYLLLCSEPTVVAYPTWFPFSDTRDTTSSSWTLWRFYTASWRTMKSIYLVPTKSYQPAPSRQTYYQAIVVLYHHPFSLIPCMALSFQLAIY
jgi:hypothetical protein